MYRRATALSPRLLVRNATESASRLNDRTNGSAAMSETALEGVIPPPQPLLDPAAASQPASRAPIERLSARNKIAIGGLGALAPILVSLLAVDLENVFEKATFWAVFGYALRVVVLFSIGGLVAFLHREENDYFKLFELGIAAPALLTTLLSGSAGKMSSASTNAVGATTSRAAALTSPYPLQGRLVTAATTVPLRYGIQFAAYRAPDPNRGTGRPEVSSPPPEVTPPRPAVTPPPAEVKTFSPPEETTGEQLVRGLLGSSNTRVWFVVAGSYSSVDNAARHREGINKRWKQVSAEVYKPYDTPYYSVVIGANLTMDEAKRLRSQAISAGVGKDIFLKRGPEEAPPSATPK
jgi:hypothetical protein